MANLNIQSDFDGFLAGKGGTDPLDWGGGTIQLGDNGVGTYTAADGTTAKIDRNTDMFTLADQYSGIENEYSNVYGDNWRNDTPGSLGWGSTTIQPTSGLLTNATYQKTDAYDPTTIKTPEVAEYVAPDAGVDLTPLEEVEYQAPEERTVNESNETVQGRLSGLLEDDSQYMQAAKASGLGIANSRGLLNSSMAAGASQKAAIEAGLPIASQDAGYYQNLGQMQQEGKIQSALSGQDYLQQGGLLGLQAEASSQLAAQEGKQAGALASQNAYNQLGLTAYQGAINAGLSAQEASQQASLAAYNGAIQSGLSAQDAQQAAALSAQEAEQSYKQTMDQEASQQAGATLRAQMGIDADVLINNANISSTEKQAVWSDINTLDIEVLGQIGAIQRDPDMTSSAKEAAINDIQNQYAADVTFLLSTAGFTDIEWTLPDSGEEAQPSGDNIIPSNNITGNDKDGYSEPPIEGQIVSYDGEHQFYEDINGDYWIQNTDGKWVKYGATDNPWIPGDAGGAGASNGMGGPSGY